MQQNITIPKSISEFVPARRNAAVVKQEFHPNPRDGGNGAHVYDLPYVSPLSTDPRIFYDFFKRGMDIGVSLLLLAAGLPLIVCIAALVKITSRGPVIYRHRRIGRGSREFECWKFRTMVSDADEILKRSPEMRKAFDEKFKIEDDPRVTRLGNVLRRTSLDELPQLIQVLQGKMSLVGPRPIIARELEKYSIYSPKLLSVKPGLSGLWQVSGRSDTTYSERVLLDMKYIDNRGALLDVKILVKTVRTVLEKSGAY